MLKESKYVKLKIFSLFFKVLAKISSCEEERWKIAKLLKMLH